MTTRRTKASAYSTVMVALIAVMVGLAIPGALAGNADPSNKHDPSPAASPSPGGHESTQAGHGCNQNGQGHGGSYDSTCDHSSSENGNGSGGGKPCAGCVGNADNKDPKGHQPGGSDSNNGYECDGNNGISKGN